MSEAVYLILLTAGVSAFLAVIGFIGVLFIKETQKNTLAIVSLTVTVEHLTEKLVPMPEMQKDVNELHLKVRNLEGKMK